MEEFKKVAEEKLVSHVAVVAKSPHVHPSEATRVGPKVPGLTYKSRAKWKMLRGIAPSMAKL
jgi:hypothetical protein